MPEYGHVALGPPPPLMHYSAVMADGWSEKQAKVSQAVSALKPAGDGAVAVDTGPREWATKRASVRVAAADVHAERVADKAATTESGWKTTEAVDALKKWRQR